MRGVFSPFCVLKIKSIISYMLNFLKVKEMKKVVFSLLFGASLLGMISCENGIEYKIDVTPNNPTLYEGETKKITVTTDPESVPLPKIQVVVEDETIAQVIMLENGAQIKGLKAGKTTATLSYGDVSVPVQIQVKKKSSNNNNAPSGTGGDGNSSSDTEKDTDGDNEQQEQIPDNPQTPADEENDNDPEQENPTPGEGDQENPSGGEGDNEGDGEIEEGGDTDGDNPSEENPTEPGEGDNTDETEEPSDGGDGDQEGTDEPIIPEKVIIFQMSITSIELITGRGTEVFGKIEKGTIKQLDDIEIIDANGTTVTKSVVTGIYIDNKFSTEANQGDQVWLLLRGISPSQISTEMSVVVYQ